MPFTCCVPNCRGNYNIDNKISVFKFPKNEEITKKWINAIPRSNYVVNFNTRVCEKHFRPEEVRRESSFFDEKTGRTVTAKLLKPFLVSSAVPSIFPTCPGKPSTRSRSAVKLGSQSTGENCEKEQGMLKKLLCSETLPITSSTNRDNDAIMTVQESETKSTRKKYLNQNMKEMHKIKLEKRKKVGAELTGRRIVDISFFLQQIRELSDHGNNSCSFKDMVFVSETQRGFNSSLKFTCQECSVTKIIWTNMNVESEQQRPVNAAAVAGILGISGGYTKLQKFASALNMPSLSRNCYVREHAKMKKELDQPEMKKAAETKKRKAFEKGNVVTKDSSLNVAVDGMWVTPGENLQSSKVSLERRRLKIGLDPKPGFEMELEPTTLLKPVTPSDLIDELNLGTLITPDIDTPDLSVPGSSSRIEPDSSMMEQDLHSALTCEIYPADTPQPDFLVKIKKEPIDPATYKQDIPFSTVVQEQNSVSNESPMASKQDVSLFHPPVLIKEEPVYFEEEL